LKKFLIFSQKHKKVRKLAQIAILAYCLWHIARHNISPSYFPWFQQICLFTNRKTASVVEEYFLGKKTAGS